MSERMTPELAAALAHAIEVFEAQHGHYDAWTAEERQAHDVLIARIRADHGSSCRSSDVGPACVHCGGRERLLLPLGDGRVACVPVCPPQYRGGAR